MYLRTNPIITHESQISLSVWQNWLYKRMIFLPHLTLGITLLQIGRSAPHSHKSEEVIHYVLGGQGRFAADDKESPFEPGAMFYVHPPQSHIFDCDNPVALLTIRAASALPPTLTLETLPPGARQQVRPTAARILGDQCSYLLSGECQLVIGGEARLIKSGTGFYIPPELEYTIENRGAAQVKLINARASVNPVDDYVFTT